MIDKIKNNIWFKNISWSLAGKAIAMIFFQILDIALANYLSVSGYSEWAFFYSVLTILFYFCWLGVNSSTRVFISKQQYKESRDLCITAALLLRIVVSVCSVLIIFLIVYGGLPNLLGYPGKYPELRSLLLIGCSIVFFNSFSEFFKDLYQGMGKFGYFFIVELIEYGGYCTLSICFLLFHKSIYSVALAYSLTGAILLAVNALCLRIGLAYQRSIGWQKIKDIAMRIGKNALPLILISMGALVLTEMDTFMLGILSEKTQVANYNIAKQLCLKATHVNNSIWMGTLISISVVTKENVYEKLKQFKKIRRINTTATVAAVSVLLIFAIIFIPIFYKEYESAKNITLILIIYYVLTAISTLYACFLDYQFKSGIRAVWFVSVIVINLILNFVLIPIYGAYGAAIATVVSLIPYSIWLMTYTFKFWRKYIGG